MLAKGISRPGKGSRNLTPIVKRRIRAEGLKHHPTQATAKGGSCELEDPHLKQAPPGMLSIVLA